VNYWKVTEEDKLEYKLNVDRALVPDFKLIKDLRRMIIARGPATHGKVENYELIPSRIVSALRRPFRECLKKDRTLVGACPRSAIGEEIPVPELRFPSCDREPVINFMAYRHLRSPFVCEGHWEVSQQGCLGGGNMRPSASPSSYRHGFGAESPEVV
jgi:hypothetical protein